ncbi:hypothetical protein [Streptomyces sp. GZWMJZ-114]|uniref:hypothetical protein n=1 Tax=Streptomyces sp. GZWMJZ-114 TaxID=2494734 RepID=UPI001013A4DC|nr:hypothetical protein [Streptomyces sp. GZWMJZ-114]
MRLWRRRENTTPAIRPPSALVVRHIRKAIGGTGATALAAGIAVGVLLGVALAAVLVTLVNSRENQ